MEKEMKHCCALFKKYPVSTGELTISSDDVKEIILITGLQDGPQTTTNEFNLILKFRVSQLIHSFPNGVEENVFWTRYCSQRACEFNLEEHGIRSHYEATVANIKSLQICGNPGIIGLPTRILFPACTESKSVMDIVSQTYHQLRVVVSKSPDKRVKLTNERVCQVVKFMETDWGIFGVGNCIRIVLKTMEMLRGENGLSIQHPFPTKEVEFLCENSRHRIQKIENQKTDSDRKKNLNPKKVIAPLKADPKIVIAALKTDPKIVCSPKETTSSVVSPSNKSATRMTALPPMTSFWSSQYDDPVVPDAPIKPRDDLKCKLKSNYGHDYFAISITDEKKSELDSEKFSKDFSDHDYIKRINERKPVNDSTRYQVESNVLAKQVRDGKYGRASVLTVLEDEGKYEVLFVDTGIRCEVPFSFVTSLPHSLMKSPAMAIVCTLRPGLLMVSPNDTGPVLQSILNDAKELRVLFHDCHYDYEYKTKIWEVSLRMRLRPGGRWMSVRDELQRQIARTKNIALTSERESDVPEEIFSYYMNDNE